MTLRRNSNMNYEALFHQFYICSIIIIELLMVAMVIHVLRYSGFTKTQKKWYLMTFIAIMICSAGELAVHCGYYDKAFKIPLTILTVIQFSLAPILAILFSGSLGLKYQGRIALGFFGASFLTEVICAPFGWIFKFSDTGYARGDAFLIYEIFYFVGLAYLIGAMFLVGRRFQHRDQVTIIMILAILVAGIVPMAWLHINITYVAIGVAACVCYIYYNDLVQQDIQAELIENQKRISSMQSHMISGLANLIENRDTETGEHILRTSLFVKVLAERAREAGYCKDTIDDHFISLLTTLAPMHDIGKIIVPDRILKKPGRLTPDEYEIMKKHAEFGGNVVREVLNGITDEEYLKFASDIATYHHERWDGAGYPQGLKEDNIPLCARIMALADCFDALISKRCYKEAYSKEEALSIIKEELGTHFDPVLAQILLDHADEFVFNNQEDA